MEKVRDFQIWLEVRELLFQVSEGKKSIDDALQYALKKLDQIETDVFKTLEENQNGSTHLSKQRSNH